MDTNIELYSNESSSDCQRTSSSSSILIYPVGTVGDHDEDDGGYYVVDYVEVRVSLECDCKN